MNTFYEIFRKVINGFGLPTVDNTSAIIITVIFGLSVLFLLFTVLAIIARASRKRVKTAAAEDTGKNICPYAAAHANVAAYAVPAGEKQISERDIIAIIGKLRDNPELLNAPEQEEKQEEVVAAETLDTEDGA
ncbi:MAG: hypothetical protein ACI4RO_05085, partial [Candidatus Scatosoma sp.]